MASAVAAVPCSRWRGRQSADTDKIPTSVNRGQPKLCREIDDFPAKAKQQRSFQHRQARRAGFERSFKTTLELYGRVHITEFEPLSARVSRDPQLRHLRGRINRDRQRDRETLVADDALDFALHIVSLIECSVFERSSYVTRWRRTGWLGRRDSKLCISKSDLLNFIPPQRVLGVDRARL